MSLTTPAPPSDTTRTFDFREYLAILRIRKWSIALITLTAVVGAVAYSLQATPTYRSRASVLVKPTGLQDPQAIQTQQINLETERRLVASDPVARRVDEALDEPIEVKQLLEGLRVQAVTNTEVLDIAYSSPDPEVAAEVANLFAGEYLSYRRDEALEELLIATDAVQERISRVNRQLEDILSQIDEALADKDEALARSLESQRIALVARLGVLQEQLEAVKPDETLSLGAGEVIEPAEVPSSPISPNFTLNIALALFVGLGLGVGIAFLRERLDDRFRGRDDLTGMLNAPLLAAVPRFKSRKRSDTSASQTLAIIAEPHGAVSEAYRSLGTSVAFLAVERSLESLVVTSSSASEGKTSTVANLGVALAQIGRRVILVSSDLRRPTLESYFGLDSSKVGLSTCLVGEEVDPLEVVMDTEVEGLRVMPAGPLPHNSVQLLSSPHLPHVVRKLSEHADVVVFDSPPTLVTDPIIIAGQVDGTVLVVNAEKTRRSSAAHSIEEIGKVGGRLVGVVLNELDTTKGTYGAGAYYGTYGYYPTAALQAPDGEEKERRGRRISLRRR